MVILAGSGESPPRRSPLLLPPLLLLLLAISPCHTATPRATYHAEVADTFPVHVPIPGLSIGASDYDSAATNNAVTFALENDFGTFSLTPAQQTSSWPSTYTTQLTLTQGLDWSQQKEYRLTITATDSGGLTSSSDVIMTVLNTLADVKGGNQLIPAPDGARLGLSGAESVASQRLSEGDHGASQKLSGAENSASQRLSAVQLTSDLAIGQSEDDCVDTTAVEKKLYENSTDAMVIKIAATATAVSLSGDGAGGAFDISQYFTVTIDDGRILLAPIQPDLTGIRDYPTGTSVGRGNCTVTCVGTTQTFPIQVDIKDSNTADPVMSQDTYSADVLECMLVNTTVPGLMVNASDYDGDPANNNLTFSLDDASGSFALTPAVKASTWPVTFSTQLSLTQGLDWSQQSEYTLTVTAMDLGGRKVSSDVVITVIDADNKAPVFKHSGYTIEGVGQKGHGPLTVHPEAISASDADVGGPLVYSLIDLPGANWSHHFHLDPHSAEISLVKELPARSTTSPWEISFIVEATETRGARFSARTVLVIKLGENTPPDALLLDYDIQDSGCVSTTEVKEKVNETASAPIVLKSATNPTNVTMTSSEENGRFDVTDYFTISLDGDNVTLTPIQPDLTGLRDYPSPKNNGKAICTVFCGNASASFELSISVLDVNTASPLFEHANYTADLAENYPVGMLVPGLSLSASDSDGDPYNYEVTFSLDDVTGTFSLTAGQKTGSSPAVYSTQLTLTRSLDWNQMSEYRLTVTAMDKGGLKDTAVVTIRVSDIDNKIPEFQQSGYTAEVMDLKAIGPLTVEPEAINATDADVGGPLKYSLVDLPDANWTQYFALDADTAELSLAKEIPVDAGISSQVTFILEVSETKGDNFSSRAVLVVYLPEVPDTTTTPHPTTTQATTTPPRPTAPPVESSDVGYIVCLVILSLALLVALVALLMLHRKGKRTPYQYPPNLRDTGSEPGHVNPAYSGNLPPKQPPRIPDQAVNTAILQRQQ